MASPAATTALKLIEGAHQMYRDGRHEEALEFYTEALSMAVTKSQKIALHSNRAACFLKLHHFKKAAEECTSVLGLDHRHTGALMLRAQTLVTLKEYQSALFDVNRLIELNPSSEVYQNLQSRLKTQLALSPIPESESEHDDEGEEDGEPQISNKNKDIKKKQYTKITSECQIKLEKTHLHGEVTVPESSGNSESAEQHSREFYSIPKPKGHSNLDYSRWDQVETDSSEDDNDDDEESLPQYRFRVKTVGLQNVK